jgi:hypothetical protein
MEARSGLPLCDADMDVSGKDDVFNNREATEEQVKHHLGLNPAWWGVKSGCTVKKKENV